MPPGSPAIWLTPVLTGIVALQLITLWRAARRAADGRPLTPRRSRRPVPWGPDGAMLAGVFLFGSLSILLSRAETSPKSLTLSDTAAFGLTWSMLVAAAVAWLVTRHRARARDFGLPTSLGEAARDASLGLSACAVALLPVYAAQIVLVTLVKLPSSHPTIRQLLSDPSAETVAAAALAAVVIAPLAEELAFRVLLQGWLEAVGGRKAWWPVVVSSAAFALSHSGQGWAPAPLFVFALGLGYIYRQSHSYTAVVAMHAAFNALGMAIAIASASQGASTP